MQASVVQALWSSQLTGTTTQVEVALLHVLGLQESDHEQAVAPQGVQKVAMGVNEQFPDVTTQESAVHGLPSLQVLFVLAHPFILSHEATSHWLSTGHTTGTKEQLPKLSQESVVQAF